jgi:hypothetical protein
MSTDKHFLLAVSKAILAEVDGNDPGFDPDSYLPPHFIEALKAAIEGEEDRIDSTPGAKHPKPWHGLSAAEHVRQFFEGK